MIVLQQQTEQIKRKVKRKVLDYIPTLLSILLTRKIRETKTNLLAKNTKKKLVYLMMTLNKQVVSKHIHFRDIKANFISRS